MAEALQRRAYLLGFMPHGEAAGVLVGELGENPDPERLYRLWQPKVERANELRSNDMHIIDDARLATSVLPLDASCAKRAEEIETELQRHPFWRRNKHSINLVRLDDLIVLQNSVNIDRAEGLARTITKDSSPLEVLEYALGERQRGVVHNHWVGQNAVLFSTPNHDLRWGNVEVRDVHRYVQNGSNSDALVKAVVIPILDGDPYIFCIRTYGRAETASGVQRVWFLTLQNGIHRAYALKSLGFEYVPAIVIDPTTADETRMLMAQWSPERQNQNGSARPPLLRDFFDASLTETFDVRNADLCIKVAVTLEKFTA